MTDRCYECDLPSDVPHMDPTHPFRERPKRIQMTEVTDSMSTTREATGEPTPRPWSLRKVTFPDRTHEWHLDSGAWKSAVIVYGNESRDWEAEGRANAALIVAAVNDYDRLRAVEVVMTAALADVTAAYHTERNHDGHWAKCRVPRCQNARLATESRGPFAAIAHLRQGEPSDDPS